MGRKSFLKSLIGIFASFKIKGKYLHHWDNENGRFVAYKDNISGKTKIAKYENLDLETSKKDISSYKLIKIFE